MSGEEPGNPPQRTAPPGKGSGTTVNVSGTPFGIRVIEEDQRVVIYYYSEIEDFLPDTVAVENKLKEGLSKVGLGGTSKVVEFDAL